MLKELLRVDTLKLRINESLCFDSVIFKFVKYWIHCYYLLRQPLFTPTYFSCRPVYFEHESNLKENYIHKIIFILKSYLNNHILYYYIKGTLIQIEKALINDCLRVPKVSWKSRFPTISNFAVIYPWSLLFS